MKNEDLHKNILIKKGDFFIKNGQQNFQIGQVLQGVLRGFALNNDSEEITTHFFIEKDLVSGNYVPNIPSTMNIQALEDCKLSVANYKDVFSLVNTDSELTRIILANFQKLNQQNHSRIEMLISGDALEKYKWFLTEYPRLLNRIPHYYIASFLGMTPTQLSRTRKTFYQQM
ncbi:Crp/Fnr family transcriptional regulator [Aureibacter tunicatorum]|uniref:CRP-like cAMP-binding protein n=1 Tax=Aureibacter tunicatorum TaxID=866807 RepID=A0AAE3XN53_9BACT|nr:Crp/Fnr family transcriptional regulator [Aureibacter tunicatorum]MDR6238816.1 CRP-like cAMP-binding protein [Aureibacter tunicatorum]BDD05257.1 DNA-binding protein [Aureibacter tunicatorum]